MFSNIGTCKQKERVKDGNANNTASVDQRTKLKERSIHESSIKCIGPSSNLKFSIRRSLKSY
jgi:hypothetical protein